MIQPQLIKPNSNPINSSYVFDQYQLQPSNYTIVPQPDFELVFEFNFTSNEYGINLPEVNGSSFSLPKIPVINSITTNASYVFPKENNVYYIPPNQLAQVVLINDDGGSHPFHLHGHDFWIVAHGPTPYDPATVEWKTVNPLVRDTISIEANGYVVIRFSTDNPGTWIFHCHIDWHFMAGLSLVFVEDLDTVSKMVLSEAVLETC